MLRKGLIGRKSQEPEHALRFHARERCSHAHRFHFPPLAGLTVPLVRVKPCVLALPRPGLVAVESLLCFIFQIAFHLVALYLFCAPTYKFPNAECAFRPPAPSWSPSSSLLRPPPRRCWSVPSWSRSTAWLSTSTRCAPRDVRAGPCSACPHTSTMPPDTTAAAREHATAAPLRPPTHLLVRTNATKKFSYWTTTTTRNAAFPVLILRFAGCPDVDFSATVTIGTGTAAQSFVLIVDTV